MPQSASCASRIRDIAHQIEPELVRLRRDLHANPELAFEEHRTSDVVSEWFRQRDIEHRRGFGKTGVAALINPGSAGPTIAIRSDMDALPIEEQPGLPFASSVPGKMHACGHDAHTAVGLGVAHVLQQLAPELDARFLMIHQPAEEVLGGARAMLDDGLFDWVRPDRVLGFHNWPPLPTGQIGWHPDVAFSSADLFDVEISGKSGHGAHPHLAIDPIVAAASFVSDAQAIISREIAPTDPAVLTVGQIEGGTARNQIPDRVVMKGTYRTQSEDARAKIGAALERIALGTETTKRVRCRVLLHGGVPVLKNDPDSLAIALAAARDELGESNVVEIPAGSMGSEDFAEFTQRVPGAHLRIGSGIDGYSTMLHRSNFNLDERMLGVAVTVLARCAIDLAAGIAKA